MINPLNTPPILIIPLTTETKLSETKPANGIKIKIVNSPTINNAIVGVTIISIAFGTILCNLFSTILKIQTAK